LKNGAKLQKLTLEDFAVTFYKKNPTAGGGRERGAGWKEKKGEERGPGGDIGEVHHGGKGDLKHQE